MSEKIEGTKNPILKNKRKLIICGIIVAVIALIASVICVHIHNYRHIDEMKTETLQFSDYVGNEDIKLIAHRGYRAIAPENTLPAYQMAGQAGFWGAECDVYRTKDGVWVLHHDPTTFRLMNKSKKIEKTDYQDIKKLYYENGSRIDSYPELRICTLEEYLDACKQFNTTPVIELKGKNNTDHYNEIVDAVKKYELKPIFISFEKEALEAMRKLTDSKMFLLTEKISDSVIKDAKSIGDCGVEFDAAEEKNFANKNALIKKAQKEGLETAAWNVNSYDMVGKLLKLNTYYMTTDTITY